MPYICVTKFAQGLLSLVIFIRILLFDLNICYGYMSLHVGSKTLVALLRANKGIVQPEVKRTSRKTRIPSSRRAHPVNFGICALSVFRRAVLAVYHRPVLQD